MTPPEPDSLEARAAAFADLDHVVRNALTIIWGRTHRVQRVIQQDAPLTTEQSTTVQRDLAAIDAAVVAMVVELDALQPA